MSLEPFKQGMLNTNGIEIHYVEKGEGPLVLFCHGWPESWYSWRHQIEEIGSKGYRAVALHMRGYGKTTKPEDVEAYGITNLVGDVVGAVKELGESEAAHLGIDIELIKRIAVLIVALGVGAAVSVSGMIGFIGLMVPHIVRMMVGGDYIRVLPISGLLGAILLLWADILARTSMAPEDMPIGIVTGLTGGLFFIWLLRRK